MTIFDLVKIQLDQLYAAVVKDYGSETDSQITRQIDCRQNTLRYLNNGEHNPTTYKPTTYKGPTVRFAYVFKYVISHADFVVQMLKKLPQNLNIIFFDKECIRDSCVGGGPGSDLIGLLKYHDEKNELEPVDKITAYLLAREQAWADTWTRLGDTLN
jgi:hypothetical protein